MRPVLLSHIPKTQTLNRKGLLHFLGFSWIQSSCGEASRHPEMGPEGFLQGYKVAWGNKILIKSLDVEK